MELTGFKESALAQVNCFDWPDVCKKANVTRYPMIKLYRGTNEVVEYGGVLDEASFLKFYLLYSVSSPIIMTKEQEGREFMAADFPSWTSKYLGAVTIGIFPERKSEEWLIFNKVAGELRGRYLMASCMGNCAKTLASEIGGSEAVVVTIKWEDVNQPEVIYDQPFSFSSLEKFVLESSEKILPELTMI
ncbi:thioredoxin domain-containing protein 16-like [Anneissia japonica]|uniref:thioredoxin domain-containing protein 16-like n=1 Tax=Anneissia japonica TaxID=1529436 RepID=UPI0014256FED|nr:thioredoxin domain-containing protein 16-like [Anneissia japonica]